MQTSESKIKIFANVYSFLSFYEKKMKKLCSIQKLNPATPSILLLMIFLFIEGIKRLVSEIKSEIDSNFYLVCSIQTFCFFLFGFIFLLFEKTSNKMKALFLRKSDFLIFSLEIGSLIISLEGDISGVVDKNDGDNMFYQGCKSITIITIFSKGYLNAKFRFFFNFLCNLYITFRFINETKESLLFMLLLTIICGYENFQDDSFRSVHKYTNNIQNKILSYNYSQLLHLIQEVDKEFLNNLMDDILHCSKIGVLIFDDKEKMKYCSKSIYRMFPKKNEGTLIDYLINLPIRYEKSDLLSQKEKKKTKKMESFYSSYFSESKCNEKNLLENIDLDESFLTNPDKEKDVISSVSELILSSKKDKKEKFIDQNIKNYLKINENVFEFILEENTNNETEINLNAKLKRFHGVLCTYASKYGFLNVLMVKIDHEISDKFNSKIMKNHKKVFSYFAEEISNPLSHVSFMEQMMEDKIPKNIREFFLNPCISSTKFLINLRNELNDLNEMLDAKLTFNFQDFQLKKLIEEVIGIFLFQAEIRGITISFYYDERIPYTVKSDARRIAQIMTNILKNTFKYAYKGTILIKAELDSFNTVKITISDSGIGMNPREKSNLLKTLKITKKNYDYLIDPYNIGYSLFLSHILSLKLKPDNNNIKGLDFISEPGTGSMFIFFFEDKSDQEDLRENEEINQGPIKNYKNFKSLETKFIDPAMIGLNESFDPNRDGKFNKKKKNSQTVINLAGTQNNYVKNQNHRNSSSTVIFDKPYFDKTITLNSFTLGDHTISDNQQKSSNFMMGSHKNSKNKRTSVSIYNLGKMDGPSNQSNFSNGPEGEFSAINQNTSKVSSHIFWSHSSDRDILRLVGEVDSQNEKIKQIKEINKQKSCICNDILLCDNDDFNFYCFRSLFEELNFGIKFAPNGNLALDTVFKKAKNSECCRVYKLIFINVHIKGITGHELCYEIKKAYSEYKLKAPPILAILNNAAEKDIKDIKKVGFSDFICKPIMQNAVVFYIKKYLNVDLVNRAIISI